ncbi:Bacteriocin-protection, YdeI protein [Candidatus Hepatincola sp. Av]
MHQTLDSFFSKNNKWHKELSELRAIILSCDLTEERKWMHPCYTLEGKSIVLIHGFKEYCAILFFKGALLTDPKNILVQQTENVQAGRQIRFTNLQQVIAIESTIKKYIKEAISIEKSGLKVEFNKEPKPIPEELQAAFKKNPALKTAFESLTRGRQRAYIFYFSSAKQSKTRTDRIEKYIQKILNGKGLDDD